MKLELKLHSQFRSSTPSRARSSPFDSRTQRRSRPTSRSAHWTPSPWNREALRVQDLFTGAAVL